MSSRLLVSLFVATFCLTSTAAAQLPGPGLSWMGSSGTAVRGFLPSCTNLPVAVTRGETVTVSIWGDVQTPFVLLVAPSATQCTPLPGFGNALMLGPPVASLASGVLTRTTPCLSCPPGYEDVRFPIPRGLPSGVSASFQAVGVGAGRVSFTIAITGTVV